MSLVHPPVNFAPKFYIEKYSKTTGISATTWYTAFEGINVKLLAFYFKQDNTDGAAKVMSMKVTVDGEEFTAAIGAMNDNAPYFLTLANIGGSAPDVGDNPQLQASSNPLLFGIENVDFAAAAQNYLPFSGHNVKIEFYFAAIGTAQEFHADIYHEKQEAS